MESSGILITEGYMKVKHSCGTICKKIWDETIFLGAFFYIQQRAPLLCFLNFAKDLQQLVIPHPLTERVNPICWNQIEFHSMQVRVWSQCYVAYLEYMTPRFWLTQILNHWTDAMQHWCTRTILIFRKCISLTFARAILLNRRSQGESNVFFESVFLNLCQKKWWWRY